MQQTSRGKFDRLPRTTARFTSARLDGYGLCCSLPTRPRAQASYPVLVHRHTLLLHASFRPRLATTPLRFANPSPPSGWIRDSHPQTVEHARHTMTVGAKPCGFRTHLGNRCAIPTFPPPRRLLDCFLNSNPERSFPQPSAQASFRLILRLEKTWAFPIQDEPEGLSIAPNRKETRLALPDPVSIRCYCLSASIVACEAV